MSIVRNGIVVIPSVLKYYSVAGKRARCRYRHGIKIIDAPPFELKVVAPSNFSVRNGQYKDVNITWTPAHYELPNISATPNDTTVVNVQRTYNGPGLATFRFTGRKTGSTITTLKANDGSGYQTAFQVTIN